MIESRLTDSDIRYRMCAIPDMLLNWYDQNARILPWRSKPTPYRVWVSEIMLQQTRVSTVIPYFERFINVLPTVLDLANADEDTLHKLWEGLGYYSRVRNLHRAAVIVMNDFGGVIPRSFDALMKLPGIGEYTAGAIASIAYSIPVPTVDGNILRVFSRVFESRADITALKVKRAYRELAEGMLPHTRPGDFNQALMELGAMVCLPNGAPLCDSCPIRMLCAARQTGCTDELPIKAVKKARTIVNKTVYLIICDGHVLIKKRPKSGILAGLWEFYNVDDEYDDDRLEKELGINILKSYPIPKAKHIFTHLEWHMCGKSVFVKQMNDITGCVWASIDELRDVYTIPSAFKQYQKHLPELLG